MKTPSRADRSAPAARRPLAASLLAAALLSAAPSVLAAGGLSFDTAQALAAERAPMLAARQASLDAATQLRSSAEPLPDPRLTLGVDNLPIGGPDRYSFTADPMTQRTIGWMQEVPNAAKRAARAQGAGARAEREQVLLDAERLGVQREVAAAWAARYYAERQLELFQALESENRLLRETVASRVAAGKAMPADATMARQDAVMLADRRDELQRARTQAQATLKRWLGDDAAQPLAGAPPPLALDPQALRSAIERQPDLLVFDPMARMTQAEAAELVAAKGGDWNWQVSYSRRNPAYGDMVGFQIGIELPLWGAKRQDPQIAAKLKDAERIGAEREDLLRKRREEIDLQLAEIDETGAKLERLQATSVPLAGERVALALAAYESGRGDLAAVLAARRERAELGLRALDLESRAFALRARLNYLTAEQKP